ncbi:MgtC/SapB family protein [Xanthomonas sp. XNM01]|uniref:MgtC/SapB family protein n=1 Tax=Xanthomonas sp. XNM01 TaxID=2769289 RepID=UPI001783A57D|nr:MgtC/SapB family protein [Xanthomonas sp. XNM01]MBD9368227.1 MgtC/SapB family protein [Xanthomonas sp. XNM01]
MTDWIAELQLLPGVLYAMALGGAIGYERELKNRPAGFRTHMLVAGTASLLLGLSLFVLEHERYAGEGLQIDPLRLVEAVIAGVSFIGAGTIFASRGGRGVEGITTAASLLMVAAIGITVGFRYYVLALAITLLALVVLTMLRWLERRPRRQTRDARPAVDDGDDETGADLVRRAGKP